MARVPLQSGNSTITPNPYRSTMAPQDTVQGKSVMQSLAPLSDVATGADPRADATGTGTPGGTIAAGHTITVTITNPVLPGGQVQVTYVTVSGDTVETVGTGIADAINANGTLRDFGISAQVNLTTGVVTLHHEGPVGNKTTWSGSSTGAETFVTTALSGGSGPIVPTQNFTWVAGGVMMAFWYGQPADVPYNTLNDMIAQGAPIS